MKKNKIYCFDLDGTLCTDTSGKYENAEPLIDRISKVNKLYDEGNTIIIESARGRVTNKYWIEFTIEQLTDWGVKYHHLRTGWKVAADVYVDDRGKNDKCFFQDVD